MHLIVADAHLPALDTLFAHLPAETQVRLVHDHCNVLEQITQATRGHRHLQSLHILGHGEPGRMLLGNQWVDAKAIETHPQHMACIAGSLADDAHIWLYGCHSAAGKVGEQWLDAWALATGTSVHGTEHMWTVHSALLSANSTPAMGMQTGATVNPIQAALHVSGWEHALPANTTPNLSNGTGGKLIVPVGLGDDFGESVIQQADGKLVVAGYSINGPNNFVGYYDFSLIRLNANGSLDTSFGNGGKLIMPVGLSYDLGRSVIQQADGKLVVAGSSNVQGSDSNIGHVSLIRLNTNGSLDTSFGTGGKLIMPSGSGWSDVGNCVIQQADGKLVVAGFSMIDTLDRDFSLIRLNANGSLDTSFGNGGKLFMPVGPGYDFGESVIQQADGKLVVAGYSLVGPNTHDVSLIRLNPNGSLDTSFGNGGKLVVPVGLDSDSAYSVIQQTDGKLVVAGHSNNGATYWDFSLIRLNANGSLDTSFGTGGKVIMPVGLGSDGGQSVIQQADGKLVVAGYSLLGPNTQDFSLIRLNANGSLDTSFGNGGKLIIPVGLGIDEGYSVIQQADGKLVVVGNSENGTNRDFSLIRLNADGSLDTSFNGANSAPTLNGVPFGTQTVTIGKAAALADFTVADADGNNLTLTLTPTNGTLDGLTDSNVSLPGIQLNGTAAQINIALAAATFTASAAGAASIGISVTDGVVTTPTTGTYNLNAISSTTGQTFTGTSANDRFTTTAGNDAIDGAGGIDTVVFTGTRADHTLTRTTPGWTISSAADGSDTLQNVERLQFSDMVLALDINGNAGQAYRIYQAAFNRTPDKGGLSYWVGRMDSGTSLDRVAAEFIGSQEFQTQYGSNPSNANFLTTLYQNILKRAPDQGGYDWWLGQLNSGQVTKVSVLAGFSESAENQQGVIGVIQNGIELIV